MSRKNTRVPDYQCWWENDFRSDFTVMQMNWLQKLLYRCLLQTAFVCETRPYVPDDDNILWILAGAESPDHWQREKDLILTKFERFEDEQGCRLLRHKRLEEDWQRVEAARQRKVDEYGAKAPMRREKAAGAAEVRWAEKKKAGAQAPDARACSPGTPACLPDAHECSTMPKSQSQSETKTETKTKTGRPAGALDPEEVHSSTGTNPLDPSGTQDLPAATSQDSDATRLANLMFDEFFRHADTDADPSAIRRMTRDATAALRSRSFELVQELLGFAKDEPWWYEKIRAADYPMAFFAKSLDSIAQQHETAKRPKLPKANTAAQAQPKDRTKPDVSRALAWINQNQKPPAEARQEN